MIYYKEQENTQDISNCILRYRQKDMSKQTKKNQNNNLFSSCTLNLRM